jgi:hypothetical protein
MPDYLTTWTCDDTVIHASYKERCYMRGPERVCVACIGRFLMPDRPRLKTACTVVGIVRLTISTLHQNYSISFQPGRRYTSEEPGDLK